jgi:hypothetical protein
VNTAGIISANINKSEYFFIIDGGSADGVIDDPVVVLVAFWILNPKINAAIPIKSPPVVRIFCVRVGMRIIGAPWLLSWCFRIKSNDMKHKTKLKMQ